MKLRRVLWVRLSSMGDVVHTLPAISDLAQWGFQCEVLTESVFVDIYRRHSAITTVHTADLRALKKHPLKAWVHFWQLRRYIKQQNFDVIIDSQGLWKSALLVWRLSKWVMGGNAGSVRENGVWRLYRQRVNVDLSANVIDRYRNLATECARLLGVNDKAIQFQRLSSPIFFEPSSSTLTSKQTLSNGKTLLFLHGISKFRRHKMLPTAHWQEITQQAKSLGYKVLTVWFGAENGGEHRFAKLLEKSGAEVIPPMSLSALIDGMIGKSDVLPKINGVITVDSGLGHLANAVGLPTLMLFGPTSARRFSTAHLPHQQAIQVDYFCSPCGLRLCQRNLESGEKVPPCWLSLPPNRIMSNLERLIKDFEARVGN